MRANRGDFELLFSQFAKHGLELFIESTRSLIVYLAEDGKIISWNQAFDSIKQVLPDAALLGDFLSLSSKALFDQLLSTATHEHIRTQGEMELGQRGDRGGYTCFLFPMSDGNILFIAEPTHAGSDLEFVLAELEKTKRALERKETELRAVMVQADEVSHTDALTFLPNRRQIMIDLQNEVEFSARYGTPLTISMLDIDHFKKVNDTHGHATGDDVLRDLAGKLRLHTRHPDTIGRYGGEEFLIVLPHSTVDAAVEQAERLCEQVRSLSISVGDQTISVTISIGIAQYKIHEEDWQTLLSRADAALYEAKSKGRDQVFVSEE